MLRRHQDPVFTYPHLFQSSRSIKKDCFYRISTNSSYVKSNVFFCFNRNPVTQNGHANIVNEINNNENFVQKKLRKTNIDLTKGTLRRVPSHKSQQFDFRAMLKKTGRLEKELDTN